MGENLVQRRFAAILAADVAGYSRLMAKVEVGTLAAVRKLRSEVFDPAIAEHKGRLFKRTGDGFLVEFPGPIKAVACAEAIQPAMQGQNSGAPSDRRTEPRIGVYLGISLSKENTSSETG